MSCYTCPVKLISEPVVISGMSGRFPESDSTDEFAHNLYNNLDLITEDNRRWPLGTFGMNQRMGKIKDIDRLDGSFFGTLKQLGDTIDPHSRILLETTYEAIIDAGINPQTLSNTKTGVYIGYSSFGMPDGLPEDTHPDSNIVEQFIQENMLTHTGQAKSLYANRISFVFDFKGPSLVTDTACSSSLVAFNIAINDMLLGKCDQAIVGATQVCLQPFINHLFQSSRVNATDGIPKVWDQKADGYVRGECVSCFLIQRKSDAKRIYATILNTGVNIDGNKKMGMFFPSTEMQEQLMVQVYKEANVDPKDVNYFEAHATGTKAGDTQETKAIYNAYCLDKNREEPLPIGLLKSIIGHCEGASGAPALVRVLLAYENECVSANLHLETLKNSIKPFCPPLLPLTQNMKYKPGIAGINNFGIGGVNAHALIEPNYKTSTEDNLKIADTIPRIVNICCRTESAFNEMCKWIEDNPQKVSREFLALLSDTMRIKPSLNSSGMPYRGSLFIKQLTNNSYEYKRQYSVFSHKEERPVWFIFPGLGGQWVGMAKALMPIKIFADKIEECHQIFKPIGIDLKLILLSEDKESLSSITNKFCATTAIEIALLDVIKELGIIPDGIMGHSFGEIAAAYADGCLTIKEALLAAYYRGLITENDENIPKGLMVAIGLSWNEAKRLCPKEIEVVCNNGKEMVVISGKYKVTKAFIEDLKGKGVFVRELDSSDLPLHSQYIYSSAEKMTQKLKTFLTEPKLRSNKWISTSIINSQINEELKYASAEYFVHNLINPVYFYDKLPQIPEDAIVIEIGPHGIFSKVIQEVVNSGDYISLMKKNSNDTNLEMFLTSIGKLYELGLNPIIENMYPKVEWPVIRGTQSISSLMRWDHSEQYFSRKYPDYCFRSTASDMNVTINLSQSFKSYIPDHNIDGNILLPAIGYLMLAWKRMAAFYSKPWKDVPVVFENVQFRRPLFFSETDTTKIKVKYFDKSDHFSIEESGNICCYGRIKTKTEYILNVQHLIDEQIEDKDKTFETVLTASDIYKDLGILGYDYGPKFKKLQSIKTNNFETFGGELEWDGNWITFIDSLLQTSLVLPFRKLLIPVMIKSLRCDPNILFKAIDANQVIEEKESVETNDQIINQNIEKGEITEEILKKEWSVQEVLDQDDVEAEMFKIENRVKKAILPYYANINRRMIVTPGVEIEEITAFPFPRKTNFSDLKLESYEFIANEDSNAIEECDRHSILEYIKVCSSLANNIRYKFGFVENKDELNVSEELINKYLNDIKEDYVLFKLFNDLSKISFDENQNFDLNKILTELMNKPENDLNIDVINKVSKNERLIRSLLDIVSENNVPKREINVLEINLTNHLMAEEVDNHLASAAIYPIAVNYTIAIKSTDNISEEMRKKSFKLIEWKLNDSQVFPLEGFTAQLIIFKDSYELRKLNLEKHLQATHTSLIEKGFLLSVFRYQLTEPEIVLNQMSDKRYLKNSDLIKRIGDYLSAAKGFGFKLICRKSDSIGWMSLLFRKIVKKPDYPKIDNIIEINSKSIKWFETIKQKLIQLKESEKKENIWLIANDSQINGIIGLINCLRLEPGGEYLRCILDLDESLKKEVNFNEKPFSDILKKDLTINVFINGKFGTYRHLTLPKDYDKTESDQYFLNIQTRDLSALQWFDLRNMVYQDHFFNLENIEQKQIQCNVYMSGLNFKDVMIASGRVAPGPFALFNDCILGTDFVGRRCDTGERVMGFTYSRSFGTNIITREDFLTTIPNHWSMDEAVTLLSTYDTVWYGLIEKANIKRGESILIHSGAGGVGQAAINVCQYYGCDIFTTVGNEDKKKYLMQKFNIPENRIFSSRNIQFKYKIKEITKGKGVDIVLNSLSGDLMDASFECVADCGRFVEIGKYDFQMNKQLDTFSFLRDISFIGVFIEYQLAFLKESSVRFFKWVHQNSSNGMIKPIDNIIFNKEEAKNAFGYMTTGKHIGKIIIKIRDEEKENHLNNNFNPSKKMIVNTKTYFNPNKVYIITGGLGGFGLEMIHWMIFLGARKLVLTSRFGVKSDYQKFIINRLNIMGTKFKTFDPKIQVSTLDTNTIDGSNQLISDSQLLGPIGGIFHLSVVLNDSLLELQTSDKFCETIDSKTKTFENLDKISRDLNLNLDYFVVFSSVSCGKGNAGQSNYGYANSICERVCELRRKDGLHGLAIQWGPIGDVGVMANNEFNITLASVVKQRVHSCLEIMDKLLQTNKSIVSSVMRAKRTQLSGTKENRLVNQLWQILGIDPKTTSNNLTLGEIGIESMFAVELQQEMEREYDIKVTLNDIKNITVGMMKDFEAGKVNELKSFAKQINESRNRLSKIIFIIPTETHTKLNNVLPGKPIYFLPPMEGTFASMEDLAKKINRPVIGLNWTKHLNQMISLKEITRYYKDLLKTLEPNGKYDIVGQFLSALIITKLIRKAPVGKAIIIDMSSQMNFDNDMMSDDVIIDSIIMFLAKDFPPGLATKLKKDIYRKPDIPSKMAKIAEEIKEFVGNSLVSKDLEEILMNSYNRSKLLSNYRLKKKNKLKDTTETIGKKFMEMRGKLLIIKPLDINELNTNEEIFEKIQNLYFLPIKGFEEQIHLETVDATNAQNIKKYNIMEQISDTTNNYFS